MAGATSQQRTQGTRVTVHSVTGKDLEHYVHHVCYPLFYFLLLILTLY